MRGAGKPRPSSRSRVSKWQRWSGPTRARVIDSVSLRKLVEEQIAKGVSIEEHPVKRAISSQPVVKPIKITAPNSVFALGAAFSK